MRVLIVDDEKPARDLLRELVGEIEGVEIAGEAANGFEAVRRAEELAPDLLLLDIRMPKLSGFEVLELLGDRFPAIFVTAHDDRALEAFEVQAVDYVLKPVSTERLRAALERARRRIEAGSPAPAGRTLARAAEPGDGPLERVLVREEGQIHVLPAVAIDYVEADDDRVVLVARGARHGKAERLKELEAALDPQRFVRIHRSYLLNVERLARLELYAKDSWIAILTDGTKLPVSRAGYARLRNLL